MVTPRAGVSRRSWTVATATGLSSVATSLAGLTAGCASDPPPGAARPAIGGGLASPWRSVGGGFIAPVVPALGVQARPGTGMYVKLVAPGALALRSQELLIAELMGGRLWRADVGFNTFTPVPAAPIGTQTTLMLGPDLSAWVLDPPSRHVLRFARDGRLLQTWRTDIAAPSPVAMALVDGGATLLVADATLGQWAELRSGGATALPVRARSDDSAPPVRVDALAAGRDSLFVLDARAGVVHRVRRDGRIVATLGAGPLAGAGALAVDRHERVFVLDGQGRQVTVLHGDAPPRVLTAHDLGVQVIGGLAVDDRHLAVSDRVAGQVQILLLAAP